MTTRIFYILLLTIIFSNSFGQINSQNFYEEYNNKTLKEISYAFIDERLALMKKFSEINYCTKGPDFTNTVISPDKESTVITVKISDNDIFVFYFLNLYNKPNEKLIADKNIFAGLYLIRNGYLDESSIKFFYVNRKIISNTNALKEEIWFDNNFYFEVEDKSNFKSLIFPNKAVIKLVKK